MFLSFLMQPETVWKDLGVESVEYSFTLGNMSLFFSYKCGSLGRERIVLYFVCHSTYLFIFHFWVDPRWIPGSLFPKLIFSLWYNWMSKQYWQGNWKRSILWIYGVAEHGWAAYLVYHNTCGGDFACYLLYGPYCRALGSLSKSRVLFLNCARSQGRTHRMPHFTFLSVQTVSMQNDPLFSKH